MLRDGYGQSVQFTADLNKETGMRDPGAKGVDEDAA